MQIIHRNPPARVDRFRTSDGQDVVIARRPRSGRRYQSPQPTGDIISCPFCDGEHGLLSYEVRKGKKGQRKVRTWVCPRAGKLPLNQGRQWDEYVESIIVRRGAAAGASPPPRGQTSEGFPWAEAQGLLKAGATGTVVTEMGEEVAPSDQGTQSRKEVRPSLDGGGFFAPPHQQARSRRRMRARITRELVAAFTASSDRRCEVGRTESLEEVGKRLLSLNMGRDGRGRNRPSCMVKPTTLVYKPRRGH